MNIDRRIEVLVELGKRLEQKDEGLAQAIHLAYLKNPWFTKENTQQAIEAICTQMLQADQLQTWVASYDIRDPKPKKTVGIIMAGNIPLVGFHDLLCAFVAGHHAKIKLSEKDAQLVPHLLKIMLEIDEETASYFEIIERLSGFDAVIATGSNNTARYFNAYFGKYPHIIRRNRKTVAILNGEERHEDLLALGQDVFRYFGLGCRNVSKLYLPKDYQFEPLLEAFHSFKDLALHHKYKNNFDYNYTLLILNSIPYQANGCILMSENASLDSRIASLHYEFYDSLKAVEQMLSDQSESIQCVVTARSFDHWKTLPFGQAQNPGLSDYADGVDTMHFLKRI
ncbi:MAG: acyl-CoA reductase [Bacteroidota bacterium]